jgi:methylated-DNA-[protein]-cysteine S-methyltransferase
LKEIIPDIAYLKTPIGVLQLTATEAGISEIKFVSDGIDEEWLNKETPATLVDCVSQLNEYFKFERKEFSLKLDFQGTAFQNKTWKKMQEIPYGKTISYLELAELVRNKENVRAIGSANSKNKLLIVIPCHRIIGANGKLVGYSAGLWRKEWLINFEQNIIQGRLF